MDIQSYVISKLGKEPNSAGKIHTSCPFHDDQTKSFSYDLNKNLFICGSTSCGVKGNFLLFYKLLENITNWREVYEQLKSPHLAIDLDSLLGLDSYVEKQTPQVPNPWPPVPFVEPIQHIQYLVDRGITQTAITAFGLHYGTGGIFSGIDLENSIVVPIYDVDSTYMTFQVRYLLPEKQPRWKNPVNSPLQNLLYGGWLAPVPGSEIWIVEGASDVWNLYIHGVYSVGLFTKEASPSQLNRLYRLCKNWDLKPVVCLDGDTHDQYSSNFIKEKDYCLYLHDMLWSYGFEPSIIYLPKEKDPGSLTGEDIAYLKRKLDNLETKVYIE